MRYIIIEGNIGVGKTSLATKLAADFKAKLLAEEFSTNPFLPKFYTDPEKYSFQLEVSFLADRYNQIMKETKTAENADSLLISDYYFTKSAIFAECTLAPDGFHVFQKLYNIFLEKIPKPDLYVFLYSGVEKLKENILKRGRKYERDISRDYLLKIENGYLNYISKIFNFPVLFTDVNDIDFVYESANYDKLKNALFNSEYKLGINRLVFG